MPELTPTEQMQAIADDAVRMAEEQFGINLDFSGDSIAALEELLDELRASFKKDEDGQLALSHKTQQQISVASSLFGAYLGEVLRRQFSGEWVVEPAPDAPVVALKVGNELLFPPTRVFQRLLEGVQQSVWDYYQFAVHALTKGQATAANLMQIKLHRA
jgi:hypothetical protein